MSKRLLDKFIDTITAELTEVRRQHAQELAAVDACYKGRIEGLESSIKSAQHQQAPKAKRKPKPVSPVAAVATLNP